ncbi:MAG: phosphoenolpyruvate carboxykinase (ATP) [Bacteroidia bacterium]
MTQINGTPSRALNLKDQGISNIGKAHWNLSAEELVQATLDRHLGDIADTGALCVDTGKYTGRSPKDKFCVEDKHTADELWWGDVNQPIAPAKVESLYNRMVEFLEGQEVFVRDAYCGADPAYRIKVRVINTIPWANLFAYNMFIRPEEKELADFIPEWTVLAVPHFDGEGAKDGIRQENFSIIDFTNKRILIGGSGYTGEIKKGIFTVMNYLLPKQEVLPMHCSANMGENGDTAIFFGLSGTGKTTLSADPDRKLIGDDEHGWSSEGVFNFEGGCYAKVIHLSQEKEPQIWNAIKKGALVENTRFFMGTSEVDYDNTKITENTRVSYPIDYIDGALEPSSGGIPENIFFLTCDAFGVLPPISRLSPGQAMYHFISGYTAKVAGTEEGITEPVATFSACFGAPFLPLHPTRYATMLGEKIKTHQTKVWLINTGWTGGAFGEGKRISLQYTRAMVKAALQGRLETVSYMKDDTFGLKIPTCVPGVPSNILQPKNTWKNKSAYDEKASQLAARFNREFSQYEDFATKEMLEAAPVVAKEYVLK